MNRQTSPSTSIESWDIDTVSAVQWPSAAIARKSVEKLFIRMHALYGAKFLEQWKGIDSDAVQRQWGIALGKMTPEQIRRGMLLMETCDLPPTLPQFIKLCKPTLDAQAAYFEAVAGIAAREQGKTGEWSDPAIYWATTAIGAFDLKSQPYAHIRRRWEQALRDAQAHPHAEPIPAPEMKSAALDMPAPTHCATDSVAAAQAAKVARSGGHQDDPKQWARRIQERIAKGDTTVTKQQARAAREALE